MNSVENLIGGSNADTLVGDGTANRMTGGAGADALWGKGGPDVFIYSAYADSNLVTGYDTIADFVSGIGKIDLSSFQTDASHLAISTAGTSNTVYLEKTSGSFQRRDRPRPQCYHHRARRVAHLRLHLLMMSLFDVAYIAAEQGGMGQFRFNQQRRSGRSEDRRYGRSGYRCVRALSMATFFCIDPHDDPTQ